MNINCKCPDWIRRTNIIDTAFFKKGDVIRISKGEGRGVKTILGI